MEEEVYISAWPNEKSKAHQRIKAQKIKNTLKHIKVSYVYEGQTQELKEDSVKYWL